MSDILARIAAYTREDVAARRRDRPRPEIAASPTTRGFRQALTAARGSPPAGGGRHAGACGSEGGPNLARAPALIAEIKKASPSKGLIRADFDPPSLARAYAAGGAACLSVLTDGPSFMGDDAHLVGARAACTLPVLRKAFLIDPWQVAESRALGADAILVILAMIDDALAADLLAEAERFGMDALVETHDEAEVERALKLGATVIGVNNRDLRSFVVDLAVTERLAPQITPHALLVAESGVFAPEDLARLTAAGARAVLVGESLMRQADVAAATRALLAWTDTH